MRTLSRHAVAVAVFGALLSVVACGDDDATSPTVEQVAGSYTATRFMATGALGAQDVLQAGGSLTVQFGPSGALTGHLTLPSQSINEDFVGTWKIDGGGVEIEELPNDTFLEDVTFAVAGNTLVAEDTFDNVRVQLTLTKQQ